jgi:hypothetical protein
VDVHLIAGWLGAGARSSVRVVGGERIDCGDQRQSAGELALSVVGCAGAADRRLAVESQLERDHAGRALHATSMIDGHGLRI